MRDTQQWRDRVRVIFDHAADLPPGERDAAVAELAAGDEAVRREVLELLAALDRDDEQFERLVPFAGDERSERVGTYRLLREVGRGGMGSVHEAVRDDDQFEKRVAIKLVRREIAGEALERRFRQERQILAGLEHPNIARLLDGGSASDGRPYLVMEFVDGEPITAYCAALGLSVRARLRLFQAVCEAVQHAHRHLVVHRDLKPDNILVTSDGVVKLLDFGVAKLLPDPSAPGTGDQVVATATALRPLTPAYASPEQLRGDPVTTSTDVYSLGVVLYELLAGRHPFEMTGTSLLDTVHMLETDPGPPSTAVTKETAAATGEGSVARLRRTLAGDLDRIVLKAMRKEPARRYASVEQFGEDIRRFLDGLPVLAQGDTLGYRASKFARRHRAGMAAVALIVVTLAGGVATTSWQARRAATERDRAQAEARKAERISEFLAGMLRSPDPWMEGMDLRVSDLLAGAAERAATEFAAEPDVLAAIQAAIGKTYAGLGDFDQADTLLGSALRIRRGLPALPPNVLAASLGDYSSLLAYRGELARAEPLVREALAMLHPATRQDSIQLADLQGAAGRLLQARGDLPGAARAHEAVIAVRRQILGPDHPDVAAGLNDLAVVRSHQGAYGAAETLQREALEIQRGALGPDHPDLASALYNLAFVTLEQRRFAAADSFFRAALELRTRLLGPEHPDVAWTLYGYATLLHDRGDYAAAEANATRVLALRGRTLPDEHPMVAAALQTLGLSLAAQHRPAEAEAVLRESLAVRQAALPAGHWLIASAQSVLGEHLCNTGRFHEAEPLLVQGHADLLEARGPDNPRTREAAQRLARCRGLRGDSARHDPAPRPRPSGLPPS
jgi:eukaryotic-like serine/threonine-protein kinase